MQQPDHDLRIQPTSQATPRRLISLGLVGLLHLVLIYALVSGLAQNLVKKGLEEIKVATVEEKPVDKPPPPPPPKLEEPPPPFVPAPDIVIETAVAPTNTITTQSVAPTPPAPKPAPVQTVLTSRGRTHTLPPYPAQSIRLEEQGTTKLLVTIDTEGNAVEAVVQESSGSSRLDDAAVSYVKSRWKWNPPSTDGKPSSAQTMVAIVWNLKNAR